MFQQGEKDCSYYLKTGHCKFGITCKFHHPQPAGTSMPVSAPQFYPQVQSPSLPTPDQYGGASNSLRVHRPPLLHGSYVPGTYGPVLLPPGVVPIPGWNPYSVCYKLHTLRLRYAKNYVPIFWCHWLTLCRHLSAQYYLLVLNLELEQLHCMEFRQQHLHFQDLIPRSPLLPTLQAVTKRNKHFLRDLVKLNVRTIWERGTVNLDYLVDIIILATGLLPGLSSVPVVSPCVRYEMLLICLRSNTFSFWFNFILLFCWNRG